MTYGVLFAISRRSSPPNGWLGATTMTQQTLVLGDGATGLEVAIELAGRGLDVTLVADAPTVGRARRRGVTAHESSLETGTLAVDCTATVVVPATASDARNLLLAGAAPRSFGAERVIALVNDPRNLSAFEDAGIETLCVSGAVARQTVRAVDAAEPNGLTVSEATRSVRLTE